MTDNYAKREVSELSKDKDARDKVLVLCSGGMDSSVLVGLYANLGYEVYTMYVYYGNKNVQEESVKLNQLADAFKIPVANRISTKIDIPWSNSACIFGYEGTNLYVEMRNLVFLSLALSCAEALGIPTIAMGVIKAGEYSDTSDEFLSNFDTLAMNSLGIHLETPLRNLDKQGVYKLGHKFGIELHHTISCNTPIDGEPCGKCQDCKDREALICK